MLVIICAKYGKNSSRTVHVVKWTQQDVPYFSSFIAKSWLNGLEDIVQDQRSINTTHPLMLVIIFAKYGKNPSRIVCSVEQTWQDVTHFSSFIAKSWLNYLKDIGQGWTDGQTNGVKPIYPPTTLLCGRYKKWGHPLSRLVIGDNNSTSVYNNAEDLTNSLTEIEPHTATTNQPEESTQKI